MLHKIYFSVCGEGYGHSSRDMAIAKDLSHIGASVLLGSYGYVLERLKKSFDAIEVKREFEMIGNGGVFDLKATISQSKSPALGFSKIISHEKKIMEDLNATWVVADGRTAAVLLPLNSGYRVLSYPTRQALNLFLKKANSFYISLESKWNLR